MAVNEHDGKEASDEAGIRIARLYRDASGEEPPPRLDRLIARAARAPVSGSADARRVLWWTAWWTAWRMPFAVAALAVVSVSLVTLMVEEDADRVTRIPPSLPAVSESAPVQEGTPPVSLPTRAPEIESGEPAAPPRAAGRETESRARADVAARRGPMSEGVAPAEAPAAADARIGAAQKAPSSDAASAAGYDLARNPVRDAPSLPPAPPAPPESRFEGQAASTEDRAGAAPQAARRSATPAAKPAPAPASAPAPATADRPRPAASPPAAIERREMERGAVSQPARPSADVAKHLIELDREPPAVWIERVLALRKQGRLAEAEGVLAEFRQRYPGATVPQELR